MTGAVRCLSQVSIVVLAVILLAPGKPAQTFRAEEQMASISAASFDVTRAAQSEPSAAAFG